MAELSDGKKIIPIAEDASLVEAAEELGVPFSCTEGNCGTCLTRIVTGMENMSPYSEKEKIFGLEQDERLMCQSRILKGRVVIDV
ncbi:ferredoxin [Spirochaetota bacterium]|nr:ferredoxin [Spirochaetota bacterium]